MNTPQVFLVLQKFINQKPDLDPADYGCHPEQRTYTSNRAWWDAVRTMRQEANSIKRDGTLARKLLREAQSYPFNAETMAQAFRSAFSGRLSWDGKELEYTTGQYFPTEYRKAASAVLSYYVHAVKPKFVPETGTIFYSSADIERAADRAGSHFFDRDTKRFFRSRILPDAFHGTGGCYFVTSEQFVGSDGHKAERKFTVRKFNPVDADISSFGPFNELSRSQALRIARIASEYPDAALEAMGYTRDQHGYAVKIKKTE